MNKIFSTIKYSAVPAIVFAFAITLLMNISPQPVLAVNSNTNSTINAGLGANLNVPSVVTPAKISNPVGSDSLLVVGTRLINFLLGLIVIAAVVTIVIAGFRMITGGANPQQIATAKRAIIWAIIGLAVALFSFAIIEMVNTFLKK